MTFPQPVIVRFENWLELRFADGKQMGLTLGPKVIPPDVSLVKIDKHYFVPENIKSKKPLLVVLLLLVF